MDKHIKEYYQDEFEIPYPWDTLFESVLVHKFENDNVSLKYENTPFKVYIDDGNLSKEDIKNAIIVGGKRFMDNSTACLDVEAFINQYIKTNDGAKIHVCINETMRVTHIFGDNIDQIHTNNIIIAVALLLTRLLPWYFKNVTSTLNDYVVSLKNNTQDHLDIFNDQIKQKGILEKVRMEELKSICASIIGRKKESYNRKLNQISSDISVALDNLELLQKEYNSISRQINLLEMNKESAEAIVNELIDFINVTDGVRIVDIVNGKVTIEVVSYLSYWDDDAYRAHIVDNHGDRYFNCLSYDHKYLAQFWKMLFETREIKIYTNSMFDIDIENATLKRAGQGVCNKQNSIKQPHSMGCNCFAAVSRFVNDALLSNDMTSALTQIIYSTKQLTIGDAAENVFIEDMKNVSCIKLPNNEFVNLGGAIAWIKENYHEGN